MVTTKDGRAPREADLYAWCDALIEEYSGRDLLYDRMDKIYFQERERGVEEEDGIEHVTMPLGTNIVDLVVDLAGSQDLVLTVPPRSESVKEKRRADEWEQWFRGWLGACERRQRVGNLRAQMAWYAAMRGMVVVRVLPVLDWDKKRAVPMLLQVRDPRFVYADWGPYGLRAVVEEWERKVGGLRQEYPQLKRVLADRDDSERVRWREYWDDRWCAYWVDGDVVKINGRGVRPHMYGCLPYGAAFARSAPLRDPARAARPLLAGVEKLLANIETLASIVATAGLQTVTSAFAIYSQRYGDGKLQLDLRPGSLNYFDPTLNERIEPIQRSSLPDDIFRLMNIFLSQVQQGTFPVALFGEVGQTMAGYAINLVTQSGRRALLPIWKAIESAHEQGIIVAADLAYSLVGPSYGDKLPMMVSDRVGREVIRREVNLDWDSLGDGFDVICRLDDPMPADRAGNLRMALEAWKGGLLSKETALEIYNVVSDPIDEIMRSFVERVVEKNIDEEARQVAIERGYLSKESAAEASQGVQSGAGQADVQGQGVSMNPADLQAIYGMQAALPEMNELANQPPAPSFPNMLGGTESG